MSQSSWTPLNGTYLFAQKAITDTWLVAGTSAATSIHIRSTVAFADRQTGILEKSEAYTTNRQPQIRQRSDLKISLGHLPGTISECTVYNAMIKNDKYGVDGTKSKHAKSHHRYSPRTKPTTFPTKQTKHQKRANPSPLPSPQDQTKNLAASSASAHWSNVRGVKRRPPKAKASSKTR